MRPFIDCIRSFYSIAMCMFIASLISSCAMMKAKQEGDDALAGDQPMREKTAQKETASERIMTDPVVVLLSIPADPYLTNAPDIDASAQQLFDDVATAMGNKQWKVARELNNRLVQLYPSLSGPYVNLGIISAMEKDTAAAENYFRQAVVVNPNNYYGYNHLGILYRQQGRFDEAEQSYRQAIEVWSAYAEAHLNLGILYDLYRGKQAEALQCYEYYQSLRVAGGQPPDKKIKGWIIDLNRRLNSEGQGK